MTVWRLEESWQPMSEQATVGGLGEAALIQRLLAGQVPEAAADRVIGDDAAVLSLGPNSLWSVDSFVAGRHFDPARMAWSDIGWRAMAAALSDLAAMGGRPLAHLLALSLPTALPLAAFDGMSQGLAEAAHASGSQLVGGNLTAASEVTITVSVLGQAQQPVCRDGGQKGDRLAVTGDLGVAALGRGAILAGQVPSAKAAAAFLHPQPAWAAAALLAEGGARAMIDVTDGLVRDLSRLLGRGALGAELAAAALPVAGSGDAAGDLKRALFGGDDYCLLAAVPEQAWAELEQSFSAAGLALHAIGQLSGQPGIRLDGVELGISGYDHFSAPRR